MIHELSHELVFSSWKVAYCIFTYAKRCGNVAKRTNLHVVRRISRHTKSTYAFIIDLTQRSQQQPNHNHNSNDFAADDGHKLPLPSQFPSFHHPSFVRTFPFTMVPMSSRSRAILEFDLEVLLFVNWMTPSKNSLKPTMQLHSIKKVKVKFISGMTFEEESAGQTVLTGQAIDLKVWGPADVRKPLIIASIDIPKKWTSLMFLCLLQEEVLKTEIISLEIQLSSCRATNGGRI
jgi:hypothetical protein